MKLWSDSWSNGERIPSRYAAGRIDTPEGVTFSENLSPHLAWSELPAATRSLALICHDFDVPSRGDDVNQAGREVPADLPRIDFFHWVLADLPGRGRGPGRGPVQSRLQAARQERPGGDRFGLRRRRGKASTTTPAGSPPTPAMAGDYFGYDGPFPPWNDSLVHHYVFTLYALGVARAPVEGRFGGAELRRRSTRYVLGEATHSGTYTLNRRLLALGPGRARRRAGGAGDAHRRRPPRRDDLECRDADAGPARHGLERARPLAGAARRPKRSPASGIEAVIASDLARAFDTAQAIAGRARPRRRASIPGCASAASASSRATPTPRSTPAGRRGGALAPPRPGLRPRRRRDLARFLCPLDRHRDAHRRRPCRALDRDRHAWRRARLPLPRRLPASPSTRRARGSSATPPSTGLLYTPRGFTLVGWSDTAHLDGETPLDDAGEGGADAALCRGGA